MIKNKLDNNCMFALVFQSAIGIRLLTLPRDISRYAGNSGWISIILAGITALAAGYGFYWLGLKYPGFNISQYSEIALGKFFGKLNMILFSVYILLAMGLSTRVLAESVHLFLLDRTPTYIIIIIMLLLCLYCLRKGIRTISIVFDLLVPFVFISLILLIGLTLTNASPKNMRPIFYSSIGSIIKGYLQVLDPILAIGTINYVLPYMKDPKNTKKQIFLGITIPVLFYLFIWMLCIMVFGSVELNYLVFPTLTLTKSIQLKIEVFERAESFFMAIWIPITFTTLVSYYLASTLNLKALFKAKGDMFITYIQIPIFFLVALFPKNIVEVFNYLNWNGMLSWLLIFFITPLLIVSTLIKTRRKKK